ncbi:unnamed protein product, partial [marine sediment metagenome]
MIIYEGKVIGLILGTLFFAILIYATKYLKGRTIRTIEGLDAIEEAGIGNTVTMKIGGKTEPWVGDPLEVTGLVKTITDGKYTPKGPMSRGTERSMGNTAILNVKGIDIILTEKSQQATDLELYRSLGIETHRLQDTIGQIMRPL